MTKLPKSALGWWAVGLTVLIFPVAWTLMTHAIPLPILDTAVAPAILVTVIDAAAVVGLLAAFKAKDRSIPVVAALAVGLPLALFFTFCAVLEILFPH